MTRDMSWNMSKRQALKNVAICLGVAAVFYIIQFSYCGMIFLLMALWPFLIFLLKALRDARIPEPIEASKPVEHVKEVPKESGNNQGLFLPPQQH